MMFSDYSDPFAADLFVINIESGKRYSLYNGDYGQLAADNTNGMVIFTTDAWEDEWSPSEIFMVSPQLGQAEPVPTEWLPVQLNRDTVRKSVSYDASGRIVLNLVECDEEANVAFLQADGSFRCQAYTPSDVDPGIKAPPEVDLSALKIQGNVSFLGWFKE